jgi:hypothetical protein
MTTPDEMARLLELIAEGRVVSRAAGDEMLAILAAQKLRYMIPRGLPTGDGIVVANKTGEDDEKRLDASGRRGAVRADVAVVTTPDTSYVIAIYTRRGEDTRWTVDNASLVVGGEVARLVHEAFAGR